jgi:hypothetical protein
MINLLPPQTREQITYARRNKQLIRWCTFVLLAIVGLFLLTTSGYVYINQSSDAQSKQVDSTREQLRIQKLEETQTKVSEISGNLKLAVQVLQRQIIFSGLIQQIASAIPSGAALTDLRISKLQGGIDLEFDANDYQTATQVQVNLQDQANKIFDKADIVSINCSGGSADSGYPCNVTIRALFAKNNPYVLVAGGSQ